MEKKKLTEQEKMGFEDTEKDFKYEKESGFKDTEKVFEYEDEDEEILDDYDEE